MSMIQSDLLLGQEGGAGYTISRSLRFNASDSAYLSRTPSVAGNRKTWTWSGWVKRSSLGSYVNFFANTDASAQNGLLFRFMDSSQLSVEERTTTTVWTKTTTQLFRDTAAWYHIVLAFDTTNATASDRVKFYVNGTLITTFASSTDPSLNYDGYINNTSTHAIGRAGSYAGGANFDGYLADIHFIDGQALTPSSFGQTDANGEWQPIAYTGTYGTNGFKLNFADNSAATAAALGKDVSGNGNNWTPTNLSVTAGAGNDSLVDTPTSYGTDTGGAGGEVRGNYCTFNPLKVLGSTATFSNGNLDISTTSVGFPAGVGTVGVSSGKWYWEITPTGGSGRPQIGICKDSDTPNSNGIGGSAGAYIYESDQYKANNGTFTSYGASFTTNDVIGVALDLDAGTITFYKNGSSQGQAFSGLSGTFFPVVSEPDNAASITASANFGQRPFAYTAPSGFKALVDTNLPTPTIVKGSSVMDVVTYTGTGASLTPTSSLGFSPDLVWIKGRSGATDHALYDTVRGTTFDIASNLTTAETTQAQGVTAFNSNGFTVGTLAKLNTNAATYAAWCWDAGSSTVTNTSGTIQSSVRASPTAGFSVVSYTGNGTAGATIGHGLGVAPQMLIVKRRDNGTLNWRVYHKDIGNTNVLYLSLTNASTADSAWNNTTPSSAVFTLGNDSAINVSGGTAIAYCFAPVAGYSSFGSYVANANSDGPFVYTGFKPRFVLCKLSSAGGADWLIFDTARSPYNVVQANLRPNTSGAEESAFARIDILSNGFKVRASSGVEPNSTNGNTYIYAAWAELPYQYSRAA